ncbi:hypothetical protein GCM10028774_64360 [Spirosoma jeollabukense]
MALYVLNFSVDPPDGHVRTTVYGQEEENLSVNEMESVGEWILEHILGVTNAVPEHDESDEFGKVTKSFFYWVSSNNSVVFLMLPVAYTVDSATYSICSLTFSTCYPEVISPPPWLS